MRTQFTVDGARIAYQVIDGGPSTLVVTPGMAGHLEMEWAREEYRAFYERLAAGRRLVRYDLRGTGLSERRVDSFDIDTQVADLVAVIDSIGARRVDLLGWAHGAPAALAFAARYPDRVQRLVLYAAYARLLPRPGDPRPDGSPVPDAILNLVRVAWGLGSRTLAAVYVPEEEPEKQAFIGRYLRSAVTHQGAIEFMTAIASVDVRDRLPNVTAPTLVLHRRDDRLIYPDHGIWLAEQLPHATLDLLPGDHHLPFFGDSVALADAILRFLPGSDPPVRALTDRETEVLRLVASGLHNRDIADRLNLSTGTVARHLANIYDKVGVSTRAAATLHAVRHGLIGWTDQSM